MGLFDELDQAFDNMLSNKEPESKPVESEMITEDLNRLKHDLANEKLEMVLEVYGLIDTATRRYVLSALAGTAQSLSELDGDPRQKENASEIVSLLNTRENRIRKVLRTREADRLSSLIAELDGSAKESSHDMHHFLTILEKAKKIGPDEVFVLFHAGLYTIGRIAESSAHEVASITGLTASQIVSIQTAISET